MLCPLSGGVHKLTHTPQACLDIAEVASKHALKAHCFGAVWEPSDPPRADVTLTALGGEGGGEFICAPPTHTEAQSNLLVLMRWLSDRVVDTHTCHEHLVSRTSVTNIVTNN